jgi:hypothetical protein
MPLGLTAALSGGALVVVLLAGFVIWRLVLARRLPTQPAQVLPAAVPPADGAVHQAPEVPATTGQDISKGENHENESNS